MDKKQFLFYNYKKSKNEFFSLAKNWRSIFRPQITKKLAKKFRFYHFIFENTELFTNLEIGTKIDELF